MLGRIERAFGAGTGDAVGIAVTRAPGDESRLIDEALRDGVATLVVAGGDGTWSKCATALARAGAEARMAFIAAGTGNDFAKNLGAIATDPAALATRLREGRFRERRVDLGRVDDQWFLNVAGFGFDVAVLRATVARPGRILRGPALYVATALRELRRSEGIECRLTDGHWRRRLLLVFSNGAHFGGAFHVAPGARVDDGALDAIAVDDAPAVTSRAALLVKALLGRHLEDRRVSHARAGGFTVEFRDPPWFEVDGELRRAASPRCEVVSLPGVLRVVDVSEGNG